MGSSGGGGQSGSQSKAFHNYVSSRRPRKGRSRRTGRTSRRTKGSSAGGSSHASQPPTAPEAGGKADQSTPHVDGLGGQEISGEGGGVYGGLSHIGSLTIIYDPGPGPGPEGSGISGCPGIDSDWRRVARDAPIRVIRPLLGVISRDLENLLASGAIRRSYEMVFRFLAEAGTLRRLDALVEEAGSDTGRPDWHLDLVDWMKESVEAAVKDGETPEHMEWAKDLLEQGLAQLLPGGDLYGGAPDPDAAHQQCLKALPDAVAKCFFCRAVLKLLRYHLSHVASRLPDLPPAAVEDLGAAGAEMARLAYSLKPATVAPGQWFSHIQQDPRFYVDAFLKIQRLSQEAA